MKVKGYKFGHPVFGEYDYFNFSPQCAINYETEDNFLRIFSHEINLGSNNTLKNMISSGKAKVIAEVSCSHTLYRKCFVQNELVYDLKIPLHNLKHRVEAIFLIIANQDIENYQNTSVKEDAKNLSFYIERGEPLGVLAEKSWDIDLENTSIESIIKIRETQGNEVQYILHENSIKVDLPKDQYNALKKFVESPDYQKILISSILQAALIHATYHLNNENFEENAWFKALKYRWQLDNQSEYPSKDEIPAFVENLLQKPTKLLMETIQEIDEKHRNVEIE